MSKIMELADTYAQHKYVNGAEGRGPNQPEKRTQWAREVLQAEVEKLERELCGWQLQVNKRGYEMQIDALRERLAVAQTANNLLDKALLASHPLGAESIVYEYWSEARKFMEATK